MKANITLTALLLSSNVDLTKNIKQLNQNIIYKNNTYKNNDPIIFNTVSASILQTNFIDTQRYITLNQLSTLFLFSNNINKDNISFLIKNYNIQDNKILLDSTNNINLPISALYQINNKKYLLAQTNCIISSYIYDYQFNTSQINYIIPLHKEFYYNLNNLQHIKFYTFPNNSIQSYLELNNPSSQIFDNISIRNNFSGHINNTYIDIIKNNNISGFSNTIDAKYLKKQINKSYIANSLKYNCYFADCQLISSYIWLNTAELQELYIKSRKQLNINYNIFKSYGLSSLYTNPQYICNINKCYYYDNQYIQQNTYKNSSKLLLDIIVKADNTIILNDQISAYIYNKPYYTNNKQIYYIKSNNIIPSSKFIQKFTEYPGTNIWFTDNNIKINYLENSETSAVHNINYYVKSCLDNNTFLIGSSVVYTYPLQINTIENITYIKHNQTDVLLSTYLISETSSLLFKDNNQNEFNVNINYSKDNQSYIWELSAIIEENNQLNTKQSELKYDLYYYDNLEKQQYLLSTIQIPIVKYGNYANTCLNQYNIITNNTSNISFENIINLPKEHILDINSFTQITLTNEWSVIDNNINISWIKFNQKNNTITNNLQSIQQLSSYINNIRNNNISYITFQNINTFEIIKYIIYPKSLFKFPGIQKQQIKINQTSYNISSIDQLNSISYPITSQKVILNSNNQNIIFNNYILSLPQIKNYTISGLYNTLPKIINFNNFNSSYILSGQFFTSNNSKLLLNNIQYGSLSSNFLIYPSGINYSYNTIDLLPTYTLTYNIIPQYYPIANNQYNYVYYGQLKLKYYGKVEILQANENIIIDLTKVFSSIQNIKNNISTITIDKNNIKNDILILPAKQGYINYLLEIIVRN